jgi:hypothetical protein
MDKNDGGKWIYIQTSLATLAKNRSMLKKIDTQKYRFTCLCDLHVPISDRLHKRAEWSNMSEMIWVWTGLFYTMPLLNDEENVD